MAIRQEELIAVNQQIWTAMLGIPLTGSETAEPPAEASCIGACVQLVGAWPGAVLLDCSFVLAQRAARRFLCRESEDGVARGSTRYGGGVGQYGGQEVSKRCFRSPPTSRYLRWPMAVTTTCRCDEARWCCSVRLKRRANGCW